MEKREYYIMEITHMINEIEDVKWLAVVYGMLKRAKEKGSSN